MPEAISTLNWAKALIQFILNAIHGSYGLVEDADNLLDASVISRFHELGWEVLRVSDTLTLRFEYESRIRALHTESKPTIIIFDFPPKDIPYDIGRDLPQISLSLKQFFPRLSFRVLQQLPQEWLPIIYQNQSLASLKPLNDHDTSLFVLSQCLGIELTNNPTDADLLGLLADMVIHRLEIPKVLQTALFSNDLQQNGFKRTVQSLLGLPEAAHLFLQEIWESYYRSRQDPHLIISDDDNGAVGQSVSVLESSHEVQTKITALIAENFLSPFTVSAGQEIPGWLHIGLHYQPDEIGVLEQQLNYLHDHIPAKNGLAPEWFMFARQWAELQAAYYAQNIHEPKISSFFNDTQTEIETTFFGWLVNYYSTVIQQPYLPNPISVNHALHYIAAFLKPSIAKPVAMVVVDGMALIDWQIIHKEWQKSHLGWQVYEREIFAFIPTITSISRQALLSGKLPRNFESNWLTTNKEGDYWRLFWEEHGIPPENTCYLRGLGKHGNLGSMSFDPEVDQSIAGGNIAVAAYIVNTLDELVHASLLGTAALLDQVRFWAEKQRYLQNLVSRLLEYYAVVIITSDHGHIEGHGIGEIPLVQASEERALRTRIFMNRNIAATIQNMDGLLVWPGFGLSEEAFTVLPEGSGLFTNPSQSGISHGGAAIEEVIVPWIVITR